MAKTATSITQVLDENREAIMALPNVIGTGISRCGDALCIKVLVSKECADLSAKLDAILGEHPYVVEKTDPIRALPSDPG